MAKNVLSNCDKMVRKALLVHGCQTSQELRAFSLRKYGEEYSTGSISAALRKMRERGLVASSDNGKGQQVHWLTDFGIDILTKEGF